MGILIFYYETQDSFAIRVIVVLNVWNLVGRYPICKTLLHCRSKSCVFHFHLKPNKNYKPKKNSK